MVSTIRKKTKMDTLLENLYKRVRSELGQKPWTSEKWKEENLNPYLVANKWLDKFDEKNSIAQDLLDIEEYDLDDDPIFRLQAQVANNVEIVYLTLENNTILIINSISNDGYNKLIKEVARKEEMPWCPGEIESIIKNLISLAEDYKRQMDVLDN